MSLRQELLGVAHLYLQIVLENGGRELNLFEARGLRVVIFLVVLVQELPVIPYEACLLYTSRCV